MGQGTCVERLVEQRDWSAVEDVDAAVILAASPVSGILKAWCWLDRLRGSAKARSPPCAATVALFKLHRQRNPSLREVTQLVSSGADVLYSEFLSLPILGYFILAGPVECAIACIEGARYLDMNTPDIQHTIAVLHLLCLVGDDDTLQKLLAALKTRLSKAPEATYVDWGEENAWGLDFLSFAACKGKLHVVLPALRDDKSIIAKRDADGCYPLFCEVQPADLKQLEETEQRWWVVRQKESQGPTLTGSQRLCEMVMQDRCSEADLVRIRQLVEWDADVMREMPGATTDFLLHYVIRREAGKVLEILLSTSRKIDFTVQDSRKMNPLQLACLSSAASRETMLTLILRRLGELKDKVDYCQSMPASALGGGESGVGMEDGEGVEDEALDFFAVMRHLGLTKVLFDVWALKHGDFSAIKPRVSIFNSTDTMVDIVSHKRYSTFYVVVKKTYDCTRGEREGSLWQKVSPHPNVAQLLLSESSEGDRCFFFYAEPCCGSLNQFLHRSPPTQSLRQFVRERTPEWFVKHIHSSPLSAEVVTDLDEPLAKRFTRDMVDGIASLHANGIVHRDIKPDNVLIAANGVAKVTDFDIARDTTFVTSGGGTDYFRSPEMIRNTFYPVTQKTDIWSLGCTVLYMTTGRCQTFTGTLITETSFCQRQCALPAYAQEGSEFIHFLSYCFVENPDKRMSAEELLKHPWLADVASRR